MICWVAKLLRVRGRGMRRQMSLHVVQRSLVAHPVVVHRMEVHLGRVRIVLRNHRLGLRNFFVGEGRTSARMRLRSRGNSKNGVYMAWSLNLGVGCLAHWLSGPFPNDSSTLVQP